MPLNDDWGWVLTIRRMEGVLEDCIDLKDQNFKDTPRRWVEFLRHYLQPYSPVDDLDVTFLTEADVTNIYSHSMITQGPIPYRAVCAHHLLPVLGTAYIGYIPTNDVVGLSKLARIIYGITHRMPSLQEDVGNAVVDALMEHLKPLGAVCVIKAEHGCMGCRGVEEPGITTSTSALRGVFIDQPESRAEFYNLVDLGNH